MMSTLKEWLNEDFLFEAFSFSEQSAIMTCAIDSSGNWRINNSSTDKIAILGLS